MFRLDSDSCNTSGSSKSAGSSKSDGTHSIASTVSSMRFGLSLGTTPEEITVSLFIYFNYFLIILFIFLKISSVFRVFLRKPNLRGMNTLRRSFPSKTTSLFQTLKPSSRWKRPQHIYIFIAISSYCSFILQHSFH